MTDMWVLCAAGELALELSGELAPPPFEELVHR